MRVIRLPGNPIIHPGLSRTIEGNINGPALIRTPNWLRGALGKYHLYFAHHAGKFIRLAYADALAGPWRIHEPGALHLAQTPFVGHIASPDVIVDESARQVRMYFHGPVPVAERPALAPLCRGQSLHAAQFTRLAWSPDGLRFTVLPEVICPSYFRVCHWRGWWYGVSMPGVWWRSRDGVTAWEPGPVLFDDAVRHSALRVVGEELQWFFSRRHDAPEHILLSRLNLQTDWMQWRPTPAVTVLRPELAWEGADQPVVRSDCGAVHRPVHQLRDPAIYEEDGNTYLLYSVAGESGIALAQLHDD